jgi:hypothetical protein
MCGRSSKQETGNRERPPGSELLVKLEEMLGRDWACEVIDPRRLLLEEKTF